MLGYNVHDAQPFKVSPSTEPVLSKVEGLRTGVSNHKRIATQSPRGEEMGSMTNPMVWSFPCCGRHR